MEAAFSQQDTTELSGKYLTFTLGDNRCGIPILSVQEIIGIIPITKVPKAPDYLKGVINLRGRIIPVVNLRTRLGLPEKPHDERTCFIVAKVHLRGREVSIGVIVDTVLEVVNFSAENIQLAPDYGASLDTRYILGMGRLQNDVAVLFDIEKALIDAHDLALDSTSVF